MIKQQFFLKDMEILRLYHSGFDDYPKTRDINESEDITDGVVEFREYRIENLEDEKINYDNIAYGFLCFNHTKNPYSRLCSEYKEFITYEKDLIDEGKLKNHKQFTEICDFVLKWSGYNLKNSPLSIKNIIVFIPSKVNIDSTENEENEKILDLTINQNDYGELTCIAKFKQNQDVVDTRITRISDHTASVESRKDWNAVDLELYTKEQLVYAHYDLSFFESISMNMSFITKQIEEKLHSTDKTVKLEKIVSDTMKIGESTVSNELNSYWKQEQSIKDQLYNKKRFEFLTKGQYERGLDIFEEIAGTHGYQEMWMFDPHFIDYQSGGTERLSDIITVLGKNLSLRKNIVFEVKKKDAYTPFSNFKKAIQGKMDDLKKTSLKFTFIGTKEHFHDRFIFLKNDDQLKAFSIGTSFNSFGDNYSMIIELDYQHGRMIFDTLMKDIVNPNHILINEDFK